jgi:hypothetical protein
VSARRPGPGKAQARLSTKDADEELAQLFLASILGVPVTVHDRCSGHSTYDLEIRYPDGRRGAAEVVSTRTQTQAAQIGAVRRAAYTEDSRLSHTWIARVPPGALISRVRRVLPEFLAELERVGITDLDRNRYYGPEMHQRLRNLHISSCLASPPTVAHPPGFYVSPRRRAPGWVMASRSACSARRFSATRHRRMSCASSLDPARTSATPSLSRHMASSRSIRPWTCG